MAQNTKQGEVLVKNTAVMYIRMALLTIIYFYTSRVLLKALGEDDFGLFSLVGSVVAMFESVKVLFTASTQRFLNYEMGKGNAQKLSSVFNTSITINLIIGVVFIILVEIVGLWFLNCKANIETSRMFAAGFVFQFSLFATVISIITTPYDACVIAHEKMGFYALMTIIDGALKLLAVLILPFIAVDSLIFYGVAVFCVTLLIRILTVMYCRKHFVECKLKKTYDRSLLRQMTSFAGWRFLGNASFTVTQNGLNMLLNVFGGTAVNAARGVAYQLKSAVTMFLNNISVVVNPYITRSYAKDDKTNMFKVFFLASKSVFVLDALLVVPLLFATNEMLNIWLGDVPQYSALFVQILLLNTLVNSLHQQLDVVFMATGRIKLYNICECVFWLLPLLLSYVSLRLSLPYHYIFIIVMVVEMLDVFAIVLIARKIAELNVKQYFKNVIVQCIVVAAMIIISWLMVGRLIATNFVLKILLACAVDLLLLTYMVYIGFSKTERMDLKNVLSNGKLSFLAKFIR